MAFHRSGDAALGLRLRLLEQRPREKLSEQQDEENHLIGAPTNSASVNCQPNRISMIMLSSATRLVDANWNAMAAVKSAPLRTTERASATAA